MAAIWNLMLFQNDCKACNFYFKNMFVNVGEYHVFSELLRKTTIQIYISKICKKQYDVYKVH